MNRLLRKAFFAIALLMVSVFFLSADAVAERTLFVYITGSDLESRCGAASADLAEMIEGMPDDGSLTVYVFTGGANEWYTDIPVNSNCLWQVTSEGLTLIREYEARSMGEAETLRDFLCEIDLMASKGPRGLVLWDHGGGPLAGVCCDERFSTEEGSDALMITELAQALAESPFADDPLEFIGFDACLMSTVEVALAVAPYARYMIASQEPEPADGWDWRMLGEIADCPDGAAVGEVIVHSYAAAQADRLSPATLSCLDLFWAEKVSEETGRLFGDLEKRVGEEYNRIAACRSDVKAMALSSPSVWDLVDLRDLVDLFGDAGIADVKSLCEALDSMVVCSWANEPYVYGVSIYSPFDNKVRYSQPWSVRYDSLPFSKEYRSFLHSFSTMWLSSSRISWRDEAAISAFAMDQRTLLYMPLESVEAENIAHARFIVLEDMGDEEWRFIFASENIKISEQAVSALYNGTALYMLDDDGDILAGPLTWRRAGEGLAVGAILEGSKGQNSVYLIFHEDSDRMFTLTDVYTYQESLGMYSVSSLWPESGDDLIFAGWSRKEPDEDLPFDKWPYGEHVNLEYITVPDDPIRLAFLPLPTEGKHAALFEVTDLNANAHLSSLIDLPNSSSLPLSGAEQSIQMGSVILSLESASIVTSPTGGLRFSLKLETQKELHARLLGVALENVSFPDENALWDEDIPSGGSSMFYINLSAHVIEQACLRKIRTFSVIMQLNDETVIISFPMALDMGILSSGNGTEETMIAQASCEELRCSIMDMKMDKYGSININLYIENITSRILILDDAEYIINGLDAYGNLAEGQAPYVILPDGAMHCSCRVWPVDPTSGKAYLTDLSELEQAVIRIPSEEIILAFDFQ